MAHRDLLTELNYQKKSLGFIKIVILIGIVELF